MKKIAFLLVVLLITSCDKNDDYNETDIDLVTGIILRDVMGEQVYDFGNPNIHTEGELFCFPNPLQDILKVVYNNPDITISKTWIIKGNAQVIHQDTNFESILNSNLYTESELTELELFSTEGNYSTYDFSSFEVGYYRIFIKFDNGDLYWDNIYKVDGNSTDIISDFMDFWP